MLESLSVNIGNKVSGGSALKLAVLMLFFVLVCKSPAGHYEVSYAGGGTIKVSHLFPFLPGFYSHDTYGGADAYGAGGNAMPAPLPDGPPIASFTCFGTITATLTWIPGFEGEEPPASCLVYERSRADWTGIAGNCDNGIGGDVNIIFHGIEPVGAESESDRAWVKDNPGESFTVTVSPFAAGSSFIVEGLPPKGCTASVRYAVAAWVPTIYQIGSTYTKYNSGGYGYHAMTGQRIDFDVNISCKSPWDGSYFTTSDANYDWKAKGGVLLDGYIMDSNFDTRFNIPILVDDEETFRFFQCHNEETQTETSADFDLTVNPLGTFGLNVKTETNFWVPEFDFQTDVVVPNGKVTYSWDFLTMNVLSYTNLDTDPIYFFGYSQTPSELSGIFLPPQNAICQLLGWDLIINGFSHPGNVTRGLDNVYPYKSRYFPESPELEFWEVDAPSYSTLTAGFSHSIDAQYSTYHMYYPPAYSEERRMPVPLFRQNWWWMGGFTRESPLGPWEGDTNLNKSSTGTPSIDEIQWAERFIND